MAIRLALIVGVNNLTLCATVACRRNQFECASGSCIHMYQRCDGVAHCPGGEDELNCTRTGEYRHCHCFCLRINNVSL